MTSVFNGLSATKKKQSLFTAVDYSTSGTNFCKGAFAGIHSSTWYNGPWGINQRDVVILYDKCGTWQVYCKFSMNTNAQNDFLAVLESALSLASSCSSTPSTPAPSLAPGAAEGGTSAVSGVVVLGGLEVAAFDTVAQASFREILAMKAGASCGASGTIACTQADVTLSVSRRSVRVAFTITMGSAAATSTSQLLSSYLQGPDFPSDLATKDSRLSGISVTSATVSAPVAESSGSGALHDGSLLYPLLLAISALVQGTILL